MICCFLNGIKIKQPYSINDLVNYLPQRPFLPHGLALNKIAAQFRVNMDEICDYFPELEAAANKKATELSGGTERLFSVLILLLAETRFTFLDEPFTHIMPLHVEQLKTILLKQKEKKGIIITDHLYRHLLDVSSKIYLIKEGKSIFIKDRNDLVLHGYINEYPG